MSAVVAAVPSARWRPITGFAGGMFAAAMWATYVVASRHGVLHAGLTPWDLSFARYGAAGLILFPVAAYYGLRSCAGVGWLRSLALVVGAGPVFHLLVVFGVVLTPVHKGGVVGPAMAGVAGMVLGAVVLGERLTRWRRVGAWTVVVAALFLTIESLWGGVDWSSLLGIGLVTLAGFFWGTFTMLLRLWGLAPLRATAALGLASFVLYTPVYFIVCFIFFSEVSRLDVMTSGWFLSQAALQGVGASVLGILAYTWAVRTLGVSVASLFPAMVPMLAVSVAWVALAESPNAYQGAAIALTTLGMALVGGLAEALVPGTRARH